MDAARYHRGEAPFCDTPPLGGGEGSCAMNSYYMGQHCACLAPMRRVRLPTDSSYPRVAVAKINNLNTIDNTSLFGFAKMHFAFLARRDVSYNLCLFSLAPKATFSSHNFQKPNSYATNYQCSHCLWNRSSHSHVCGRAYLRAVPYPSGFYSQKGLSRIPKIHTIHRS